MRIATPLDGRQLQPCSQWVYHAGTPLLVGGDGGINTASATRQRIFVIARINIFATLRHLYVLNLVAIDDVYLPIAYAFF